MKKTIVVATTILTSTQAFAGNLVEPMMEPEVVEATTGSSDGAMLGPILMIALLAATIASGGGNGTPRPVESM